MFSPLSSASTQKKTGLSLRSERECESESLLNSSSLQERLEMALSRCNKSPEAYGNLKKKKFLCLLFAFSPDRSNFYITTITTFLIVAANFGVSFHVSTRFELIFVFIFLSTAFWSSFLVCSIDPGVYPRLKDGEADPLNVFQGKIVFCRFCHLYRPPRTSHCHTCNVCILDHDHHCSILGGCVGKRTLRFFALYLVSLSISILVGITWIGRVLYSAFRVAVSMSHRKNSRLQIANTSLSLTEINFSSVYPEATSVGMNNSLSTSATEDNLDLIYIPALFVLVINIVVLLFVGAFTLLYVYFFLTSLTRRESQRGQGIKKTWRRLLSFTFLSQNFWDKCFPPPSLLTDCSSYNDKELA